MYIFQKEEEDTQETKKNDSDLLFIGLTLYSM